MTDIKYLECKGSKWTTKWQIRNGVGSVLVIFLQILPNIFRWKLQDHIVYFLHLTDQLIIFYESRWQKKKHDYKICICIILMVFMLQCCFVCMSRHSLSAIKLCLQRCSYTSVWCTMTFTSYFVVHVWTSCDIFGHHVIHYHVSTLVCC